jgi:hypothetical protein
LKSYPVNTLKENRSFKGASQKGFLSKSPHGEIKSAPLTPGRRSTIFGLPQPGGPSDKNHYNTKLLFKEKRTRESRLTPQKKPSAKKRKQTFSNFRQILFDEIPRTRKIDILIIVGYRITKHRDFPQSKIAVGSHEAFG